VVLGVYYFQEQGRSPWRVEIPAFGLDQLIDARIETDNWAVFGQLNYRITHSLSATAGLRYSRETKDYLQAGVGLYAPGTTNLVAALGDFSFRLDESYDALLPKLGLELALSEDVYLYGSATKGFKSGGFDFFGTIASDAAYDPEEVWAYEIGAKLELLDNTLRVNLAAFHYDLSDLQVQIFTGPAATEIANASDATVDGVELELVTRPVAGLEIVASATWLDAKYQSFESDPLVGPFVKDLDVPAGPGGRLFQQATLPGVFNGNRLNSSPEWTLGLSGRYTVELDSGRSAYALLNYSWQDEVFFRIDNDPRLAQSAYGLLNAKLAYVSSGGEWELALWGRNLTDEVYYRTLGDFTAGIAGRPGDPRTYGVQLSYSF
jgi:iron complex outermembrane receptor protein